MSTLNRQGTALSFLLLANPKIKLDEEDLHKFGFYLAFINEAGYVMISQGKKYERLHRVILGLPAEWVDHINRDRLDNRRINLRTVTATENNRNRSISCANKSGVKGVSFCNTRKKWIAYVSKNGKNLNLGGFIDKEAAIAARERANLI